MRLETLRNGPLRAPLLALPIAFAMGGCEASRQNSVDEEVPRLLSVESDTTGRWVKVTTELSWFNLHGTQRVRYGAGEHWVERTYTDGTLYCSNWVFGDPIVGTPKQCDLWVVPSENEPPAAGQWTTIAQEGGQIVVGERRLVRYGAELAWLEKLAIGRSPCTSSNFGGDPLVGTRKRCELWSELPKPALPPGEWTTPRDSARIFLSGHHLTAEPLAADLVRIADSLGKSAKYNEQIVNGSTIRERTRGAGDVGWEGYSLGDNRDGSNLDVLSELRSPRTLGGDVYDTLLVTEHPDLLTAISEEDTVKYLRHYHERMIESNPNATTYFYEPWFALDDVGNVSPWVQHERVASQVWQCVATRINRSLEAEGRHDRIVSLPAGLAFAEFVAQVPEALEGTDELHVSRLGTYYLALVSYAAIFKSSPYGAWAPEQLDPSQASSLQMMAWNFVATYYGRTEPPRSLASCQTFVREWFCHAHWDYRKDPNRIAACRSQFAPDAPKSPFDYDASSDGAYWLPAP